MSTLSFVRSEHEQSRYDPVFRWKKGQGNPWYRSKIGTLGILFEDVGFFLLYHAPAPFVYSPKMTSNSFELSNILDNFIAFS